MNLGFVTTLVTVAALSLSAPPATARQPAGSGNATGFVPDRLARVGAFIQSQVDAGRLPGAVLLLARHGRIATLRAFGSATLETKAPMKTDSLFRMASASKIVTSAGVLALAEEGRFALGDSVGQYLPEFRDLKVRSEDGSVRRATARLTIRDLLRHTAGFGYGADPQQLAAYQKAGVMPAGRDDDWTHSFTLERWSSTLAAVPLDREPGTRFEYGLGSDIAGALIERVSGQRLDEFLRQRIFAPSHAM